MIGLMFGKLIVIEESFDRPNNRRGKRYLCKCDCGNELVVRKDCLKDGNTRSCGCLHGNRIKPIGKRTYHGKSRTSIYNIWIAMLARCYNKKCIAYPNYGGRGIIVCDKWFNSFEEFYKDMGDRPEKLSLDRINNNGNYEPSNCKWSTSLEQSRNRRNVR